MFGSSSSATVLARSKMGAYNRISAARTSVFHNCKSCSDDRSPESLIQCIKQSFLTSKQGRFLGGLSDSLFVILLSLFPKN